jgi:hypothetical protein
MGYAVKIPQLRKRLELMGEHCVKQNIGSPPFKFGFQKDYWPMMPGTKLADFNTKYGEILEQETIWERYNKTHLNRME